MVECVVCLGRRELGDSLGSFTDSMLGQFSGKHQSHARLDFRGGESGFLVVGGELASLGGNALEDISDEGVHDGHALLGDTSVRMDLFQDPVNVRRVTLGTLFPFALSGANLLGNGSLGRLFGGSLGHL